MSIPSLEASAARLYRSEDTRGERFQLWRISNLAAELPSKFNNASQYLGYACVASETAGLRTTIALTEQLPHEGEEVFRATDIIIERETMEPRKIAALSAKSIVTDEVGELLGITPKPEYFMLGDDTSTMSLAEVKRKVRLATRVARSAQIAELLDEFPIIPTAIP
jgi:hypothetical protein